ncbi:hypothetical protein QU38_00045, partial [Staphylococcus aureus]
AGERQHREDERPAREGERAQVEHDEGALFLLVVDDVQGVEHRLHGGVRAPEGEREAGEEGQAQGAASLGGDALPLLADDVDGAGGQHALERGEVLVDDLHVGEEAVAGDERRDRREERQQRVEGHA